MPVLLTWVAILAVHGVKTHAQGAKTHVVGHGAHAARLEVHGGGGGEGLGEGVGVSHHQHHAQLTLRPKQMTIISKVTHCNENLIYVFPEKELRGRAASVPNTTFMCL
jgi:hypothetical protein